MADISRKLSFLSRSSTQQSFSQPSSLSLSPSDYSLGPVIGTGSSASVYLASHLPSSTPVSIKVIDLDLFERNQIDQLRSEIQIMSLSKHPNLLPVYGSFVNGSKLFIVTPFLAAGSCLDIMKTSSKSGFDEHSIATILKQALLGLDYLHKNGLIHRDVKAGNLLIDKDGLVQLADFGVSSSLMETGDRRGLRKTFVGTPCWMAPEVMEQSGYDYKADIWSFGITALELAHGHAPYAMFPPLKVLMLTLQNDPPSLDRDQTSQKYSKAFKDMIDLCLKKDPSKRPSAEKLLQLPFFKSAKKPSYLTTSILANMVPITQRQNLLKSQPHPILSSHTTASSEVSQKWDFDDDEDSPGDQVSPQVSQHSSDPSLNQNSSLGQQSSNPSLDQQSSDQQPTKDPSNNPSDHQSSGHFDIKSTPKPRLKPPAANRPTSVSFSDQPNIHSYPPQTISHSRPETHSIHSSDSHDSPSDPQDTDTPDHPKKSRFVIDTSSISTSTSSFDHSVTSPTPFDTQPHHPTITTMSSPSPPNLVSPLSQSSLSSVTISSSSQPELVRKGRFSVFESGNHPTPGTSTGTYDTSVSSVASGSVTSTPIGMPTNQTTLERKTGRFAVHTMTTGSVDGLSIDNIDPVDSSNLLNTSAQMTTGTSNASSSTNDKRGRFEITSSVDIGNRLPSSPGIVSPYTDPTTVPISFIITVSRVIDMMQESLGAPDTVTDEMTDTDKLVQAIRVTADQKRVMHDAVNMLMELRGGVGITRDVGSGVPGMRYMSHTRTLSMPDTIRGIGGQGGLGSPYYHVPATIGRTMTMSGVPVAIVPVEPVIPAMPIMTSISNQPIRDGITDTDTRDNVVRDTP